MSFKDFLFKKEEEEIIITKEPTVSSPVTKTVNFTNSNYSPVQTDFPVTSNTYSKSFDDLLNDGDFKNYMGAVDNLSALSLPEEVKYKTAFNTIKFTGITPDRIVKSANEYLTALDIEHSEFNQHVTNKRTENKTLEQKIEEDKKLVEETIKRIDENRTLVANSKTKIDTEEFSFNQAFSSKITSVEETITKINTYLNESTK